jgi:hypothetical protein
MCNDGPKKGRDAASWYGEQRDVRTREERGRYPRSAGQSNPRGAGWQPPPPTRRGWQRPPDQWMTRLPALLGGLMCKHGPMSDEQYEKAQADLDAYRQSQWGPFSALARRVARLFTREPLHV